MLSSRKRTTDKNEKDGRKSSVKSVKSSVDNEKATTSKKLEKTPKLHVDLEKDSKAIPSNTKKIVSSVVKSNVSADRLQNKIKALKGNHQVVTNTKDLPIKRKVDNDSSKVALVKKSPSSLVRKSSSKHSDTISNKNNVAKKPLTNVTINSPKQKRKELQLNSAQENRDEEKYFGTSNDEQIVKNSARSKNNVSEKQEINLNNHKRYRTRTLEPEEIKIIDKLVQNIEYSDNNISEVNVNRKLLAQPKAFFISLDEQNKAHGSKEKNTDQKQDDKNKEDENDALSYEDDFESYESDFESFNSSDKSSKVSESEIDEVSSTTSGLSSLNNINQNKVKDDKIFDSGNYELGESQKTSDTKSNVSPQRINENVSANNPKTEYLPQSMASLTDEGFDENSAGPLCSINNISISSKTESNIIHNDDNINNKSNYSQRAQDLKELIVLDHVKYFLFEMFPMSYDSFIMIHGKSNMKQVMCQTNDDYIDEDVQTDLIPVENKWTQHPIEFSDSNIIFGKNDDKDKKNYTKDKFSPLEIYVSQKSGCGSDSLVTNTEIKNKLSIVHRTNFAKLTKFIDKTGKCILNYLDDIQRFSSEDTTALRENPVNEKHPYNENEKYIYEIIKQRPLEKIQFSKMDSNIILTIHPVKSEHISKKPNIDMCSIICTWFLKGNLLKPSKMLGTIGNIKCCEISKGLSGIVVAGLEDG